MATLVFGAIGTLVGGPLGGALGSLLGRELDRQIIGAPAREGPRLKELAISTSSYGTPIARLFGTTRASGTIIWATEIRESRETAGGGKGQPKTSQYSYSISLAVALSSRPIERVGRIWADGNLLRGQAGDLKTGGTLRIYAGHADQRPDPLLAAALGPHCPAHRGTAYAVFEDLALGDFGNRIPALSFEVFADGGGADLVRALTEPAAASPLDTLAVPAAAGIAGFAHDGGSLAAALGALEQAVPLLVDAGAAGLAIGPELADDVPVLLPEPLAWAEGEFGTRTGRRKTLATASAPTALRYYDSARDYQPGLQRAAGRAAAAGERTLELPATMAAPDAASLLAAASVRARMSGERAQVRVASLAPALLPGRIVSLAGEGLWRVEGWEWRSGGIELDLVRVRPGASGTPAPASGTDSGMPWRPSDRLPAPTLLRAFELPWDGTGSADTARIHVAAGAGEGRWAGAALYVERAGALLPLAAAGPERATLAVLADPLAPSPALMFEPRAALIVTCQDPDAVFTTIDGAALAAGGNAMAVGLEVLQFMAAEPLGGGRWRLAGLLRGRAGTEDFARQGHAAGTGATLLDNRLELLDGAVVDPQTERIAAIGAAEAGPVFTAVEGAGRSRQPPSPVHGSARRNADGSLQLGWTRRARGGWWWPDGVDLPLVEEAEAYEVGAGPPGAPLGLWPLVTASLTLPAGELPVLPPGTALWVRQVGTHAKSPPLPLTIVP